MIHRRIAIAIGVALVIGAFMYGATKLLTNQAFAVAVPCSLTVNFKIVDPPQQSTYIGSLDCQGLAGNMPAETIHLTLHDITTGSITNQNVQIPADGFFEQPVTLVPGH